MYYPIKYGAVCAEDYLPFYDPENPEVKEGENVLFFKRILAIFLSKLYNFQ